MNEHIIKNSSILIVDDDDDILGIIAEFLHQARYCRIHTWSDPVSAIDALPAISPDIILLDVEMPGMSGPLFLDRLRDSCGADRPPVVVMSRFRDSATRRQALLAGASDFLAKPLDRDELLVRLYNLLELWHLQSARRRDVHRLVEYSSSLEQMNLDLEQFAWMASSSLREPLRNIASHLSLLERSLGNSLGAESRQFLDYVRSSACQMDGLILALLEYFRTGRSPRPFVSTTLDEVIQQVLLSRREAVRNAAATVTVTGASLRVTIQPEEFQNILGCLLDNALQYRHSWQRTHITVSCSPCISNGENAVIVRVQDDGIGIDPVDFDRIFRMFHRLHGPGEYGGGNGIGLPAARRAVEARGGTLTVCSSPGLGSTFSFTIPEELPVRAPLPPAFSRQEPAFSQQEMDSVHLAVGAAPAAG